MNLITSSDNQCAAAAFAMAADLSMSKMLDLLRHDGLKKVCDQPEPNCYQGFHPQEFIDVLLPMGWAVVMIEAEPLMIHGTETINHAPLIWHLPEQRFFSHMVRDSGVVFGALPSGVGHAMAWDHEEQALYDPRGRVYHLYDPVDFDMRQFFIMRRTI